MTWADGDASSAVHSLDASSQVLQVRFWDCGVIQTVDNTSLVQDLSDGGQSSLSEGLQVTFSDPTTEIYHPGDYWLIPVRTGAVDGGSGSSTIHWETTNQGGVLPLKPMGPERLFAPLATVEIIAVDDGSGGSEYTWQAIADGRRVFPGITEMSTLLYAGGDGQSALPNNPLGKPIQVSYVYGPLPMPGQAIIFELMAGAGSLAAANGEVEVDAGYTGPLVLETDVNGMVSANWSLPLSDTLGSQQVKVSRAVPNEYGNLVADGPSVFFTAQVKSQLQVYSSLETFIQDNPNEGAVGLVNEFNAKAVLDELMYLGIPGGNSEATSISTSGEYVYIAVAHYVYKFPRALESLDNNASTLSGQPKYDHGANINSVHCDGKFVYIAGTQSPDGYNIRKLPLSLEAVHLEAALVNEGRPLNVVFSNTDFVYWGGAKLDDTGSSHHEQSQFGSLFVTDFSIESNLWHPGAINAISASKDLVVFAGELGTITLEDSSTITTSLRVLKKYFIGESDLLDIEYSYHLSDGVTGGILKSCIIQGSQIWVAGNEETRSVLRLSLSNARDAITQEAVLSSLNNYQNISLAYDGQSLYLGTSTTESGQNKHGELIRLEPQSLTILDSHKTPQTSPINALDTDGLSMWLAMGRNFGLPNTVRYLSRHNAAIQSRLFRKNSPSPSTYPFFKLAVPIDVR